MAQLRYKKDYHSHFDPNVYLKQNYKNFKKNDEKSWPPFIKALHEFWSNFKAPTEMTDVRYLEFGGGSSIMHLVFACPKVDHIVFSEYTEGNREAVKSWIAGDPNAHNWMPLIEIAVREQSDHASESSKSSADQKKLDCALNRANEVKQKIKSIVPCDVNKAPIVQLDSDDVGKPFDVVSTSLCLSAAVSSEEHCKNTVAELCKFLKPNGYLFMSDVLGSTFYYVGQEKFYSFLLTEKLVKKAMVEAGIEIEKFVKSSDMPVDFAETGDGRILFYAYGKKSMEK